MKIPKRKKSIVKKNGVGSTKCDGCNNKKKDGDKGWKYIHKLGLFCPDCTTKRGYDPTRPGLHKLRKSELDKWK